MVAIEAHQFIKQMRQIVYGPRNQVHNSVFILNPASDPQQPAGCHLPPETFKCFFPDNDIGDTGFVFQGQKCDTLRCFRPLAYQNQPGNRGDGSTC